MKPRDQNARSHLHWAVKSGEYALFKMIFDKWDKTKLTVTDDFKKTIMFDAVMTNSIEVQQAIFDSDRETVKELMATQDTLGKYPIHMAALVNNRDAVERFIELGQDVNLHSIESTPLVCASAACAMDVFEYLLSLPQCYINGTVTDNKTALIQTIVTYFNHRRTNARRRTPTPMKPFLTVIFRLLAANADMHTITTHGIFKTARGMFM